MGLFILQKILCSPNFPVQSWNVLVSCFLLQLNANCKYRKGEGKSAWHVKYLFFRLNFVPLGSGSANSLNTDFIACWTFSHAWSQILCKYLSHCFAVSWMYSQKVVYTWILVNTAFIYVSKGFNSVMWWVSVLLTLLNSMGYYSALYSPFLTFWIVWMACYVIPSMFLWLLACSSERWGGGC